VPFPCRILGIDALMIENCFRGELVKLASAATTASFFIRTAGYTGSTMFAD
jgi:hypothetical protein